VVIGLDGGTWRILEPLIDQGRVPFLADLVRRGVHGTLMSTVPAVTAPAWTSFLTGKNPGKHGLFDFQRIEPGASRRRLSTSADCRSATVLDYLSHAGRRLVCVNIPLTFPPPSVCGTLVAGFPVPPESIYVHPSGSQRRLAAMGYLTDWRDARGGGPLRGPMARVRAADGAQIDAFGALLGEDAWDVAIIVVSGTDHVGHLQWQAGDVRAVFAHYEFVDRRLRHLAERGLFEGAAFVVVSDHGFGATTQTFFANAWLRDQGYLAFTGATGATYDEFHRWVEARTAPGGPARLAGAGAAALAHVGLTRERATYLARRTGLIRLLPWAPVGLVRAMVARAPAVDWTRTKAYLVSRLGRGFNVNLAGREATGIVPPAEYAQVRGQLVDRLRSLRGPDGRKLFALVDVRENVYHGPYVEEAPDVLTWPADGTNVAFGGAQPGFLRSMADASHVMEGVYVMAGAPFPAGGRARDLHITDIAPTLLHALGLPVPDDMDGRVSADVWPPGTAPAVSYRSPLGKYGAAASADLGAGDEGAVLERLRALGYVE
jgi:predicted AlkP superfamily phosphohydrolase/phosphomutase